MKKIPLTILLLFFSVNVNGDNNKIYNSIISGFLGQPHISSPSVSGAEQSPSTTLTNGLVTYVKFDDSFEDQTGSMEYLQHFNVTFTNDAIFGKSARFTPAPYGSGQGSYLLYSNEVPYLDNFGGSTTGFAYSTWMKYFFLSGDRLDALFGSGLRGSSWATKSSPGGDLYHYFVRYWPNAQKWALHYANGVDLYYPAIPSNQWNHIVINYNGYDSEVFYNGISQGKQIYANDVSAAGLIVFGRWYEYDHWTLNGMLDETITWNRPLTTNEILELYNSGAGKNLGQYF